MSVAEDVGSYGGDSLDRASLEPTEYEAQLDRIGSAVVAHTVEDRAADGRSA
jgi:hypothetical protein